MADSTRILEKFNNEQIFGKLAGDEKRNPNQISQSISGPYSVKQLVYPEDLGTRPDLQHYIVFYINARGKTKFKQSTTVDVDVSSTGQNILQQDTIANQAQIQAAAAVAAATGGAIYTAIRNALGSRTAITRATAARGALAAGAAGAATGASIAFLQQHADSFSVKAPERLTDAIMLPIQSIPKVSYSAKYKEFDFGLMAGLLGGSSAIDTSGIGRVQEGVAKAIANIGQVAAAAGFKFGEQAVEAAKFAAKVTTNPFKEVLFDSIGYRTFTFNYTFLPKSQAEVYNVRRIIDLFKFHMHPELSKDGLFYVYPSEFEMQYYFRGERNNFIHKISTCVLKDMAVAYGDQNFSSFSDGAPTEISMALTFQELELLTKERIVKGY